MVKQNLITKIFNSYLRDKDIRNFKTSLIYYFVFRILRIFLSKYIKIKIFNFYVLASSCKNQASYYLIKKCDFEDQHQLLTLKKISDQTKIFFLDCGSNYGFYSLYVASLSHSNIVLSYEASPTTKEIFQKNIDLNNFKNIDLKNLAISDLENKEVILYESKNDWESSVTHSSFYEKSSIKVKSTTIDFEMKNKNLDNYFLSIKLDIEGNEFNAIYGASNTIKKYSPLIIIELSNHNYKNREFNFDFFQSFLKKNEYLVYDTRLLETNYDTLMQSISNLHKSKNKTIGNYYIVRKFSNAHNFLINQ